MGGRSSGLLNLDSSVRALRAYQLDDSGKKGFGDERLALFDRFNSRIIENQRLGNFVVPSLYPGLTHRWFNYAEADSERLFNAVMVDLRQRGAARMLDPFAGTGSNLFAAARRGLDAHGTEVLPIAYQAARARKCAMTVDLALLERQVADFGRLGASEEGEEPLYNFPHLITTEGAFPDEVEAEIGRFIDFTGSIACAEVRSLFLFAAMCVLESVSYISRDPRGLRWDKRARRINGRLIDMGYEKQRIEKFGIAVTRQLRTMAEDIRSQRVIGTSDQFAWVEMNCASSLERLALMPARTFDLVFTTPPPIDGGDLVAAYELELAFLEFESSEIEQIRSKMISNTSAAFCKREHLAAHYEKNKCVPLCAKAIGIIERQGAVQELLELIMKQDSRSSNLSEQHCMEKSLEGTIRGYFEEMALVIAELGRVVVPGAMVVMTLSNAMISRLEVPVDLILSNIAEEVGFRIERIWKLRGAGEEAAKCLRQNMRKSICVWSMK